MTMIERAFQNIPQHPSERITDGKSKPQNADFAILDLAQQEENVLLGWLYSHFEHKEIPWISLYFGSEQNSDWKAGPILVELRGFDDFQNALIERCRTEYLSVLIHARDVSLATMAGHLRSLITVQLDNKPALFRFYDPRSLGPLLEVLEPAQRQRLTGPAERWSWYQYQNWHQWEAQAGSATPTTKKALSISAAQRVQMDTARSRQFAQSLTHTYRAHIPDDDAETFVMNEVQAASSAGLTRLADQERWLRMALKVQRPLIESPQWCAIVQSGEKTAAQILNQLECEQGCTAC
ncbi:MAG: DUF4123 domain-containing protein [Marinobacter sp.]